MHLRESLTCILSTKGSPFKEGSVYSANILRQDTSQIWIYATAPNDEPRAATWDVWLAPSGLYYVLKCHCQPQFGVWAVFTGPATPKGDIK